MVVVLDVTTTHDDRGQNRITGAESSQPPTTTHTHTSNILALKIILVLAFILFSSQNIYFISINKSIYLSIYHFHKVMRQ